ncbi:CG6834, partial [Drosophila busckii]
MGQSGSKSKQSYRVSNAAKPQTKSTPEVSEAKSKVVTASAPAPVSAPAPTLDIKLVPKWIDETHFVDILRESLPQFSKIQSFHIKPAMCAGENYATLMLRVSIDAELTDKTIKPVSYMMKVPHDTPTMQQMLEVANFFDIENAAYMDLVPRFEQLYKDKGIDVTFGPRAYKFKESLEKEPKLANTVVMRDLGQDGYKNVNRLNCLDFEGTKLVLRRIAQYHAAGAQYQKVHGAYPDRFLHGMFGNDPAKVMVFMEGMIKPMQKMFLSNLKHYKDGEKYHDKMEKYFNQSLQEFITLGTFNPHEFNVMNHGDCWVNNFLFKTAANGELVDMLFVDFQNPRYGHPAADLLYFIMTSVHIDYKLNNFDYFIKYYHEQVTENLKLLDYDGIIPSLRDLHMQMYKYGAWAVTAAMMVLPVVLLESNESATFDNFIGKGDQSANFQNLMFTSKRYISYINEILPWLDNRGLLEVNDETKPQPIAETTPTEAQADNSDSIPSWLTSDYFKDIRSDVQDIKNFRVAKATEAGDNYSSVLLAVDMDFKSTSGQSTAGAYMLKIAPSDEASNKLLDMMLTFKKELTMYNEVIPELQKLYELAGHSVSFAPANYKFKKDLDSDYLLLENMRPAGYKNACRLEGLNLNETEHVLAKLALLHAASAQLYATKGNYDDCLTKPLYNEKTRPIFEGTHNKAFAKASLEAIGTFKGSEQFADKMKYVLDNSFELTAKAEVYDETEFNCLNHGDCWTNNILFAYDDKGEVKDTLFIDFQRSSFGSPARDLYYFIFNSTQLEIKIEKFDHFIRYYHGELERNLKLLNYSRQIPTLKELHYSLLKNSFWAVSTVAIIMSIILVDPSDNASIATMLNDDENGRNFIKKLFQSERYCKHAEAIYPWLNHRGLLEF